jgi:hypothetical protein
MNGRLKSNESIRLMKKCFIFYIFLLLRGVSIAQDFSASVQLQVNKIIANGEIKQGTPSRVDSTVLSLLKVVNFEDLEKMSRHKQPLIRVAALICLLERDEQHRNLKYFSNNKINEKTGRTLMSFLQEHLSDTATINWRIVEDERVCPYSVIEIYLKKMGNYFYDDDCSFSINSDNLLDEKEQRFLDSLLICTDKLPKKMRQFKVLNLNPIAEWYEIVKNKAKKELSQDLIVYLSKYQKEEDIDFILANISPSEEPKRMSDMQRLQAFYFFQHPKMFAFLQKEIPNTASSYHFINLIAVYKNEMARNTLEEMYEKEKKKENNNIATIESSLGQYYTPLYNHLAWKILKENSEDINLRIPPQLWQTTYADSLVDYYYILKKSENKWTKRRAIDMFLDLDNYFVAKKDNRRAKLVLEQIEIGGSYRDFYEAFEKIWRSKDSIYTEPLFELLKNEPLGVNRFFLCKILLHQPDKDIENQLIMFFEKNLTLFPTLKNAETGGATFSDLVWRIKYRDENKK